MPLCHFKYIYSPFKVTNFKIKTFFQNKKKIWKTFLISVLSRYGSVNGLTFALPERSWMFTFKVQSVPINMVLRKELQSVPINMVLRKELQSVPINMVLRKKLQGVPIKWYLERNYRVSQ